MMRDDPLALGPGPERRGAGLDILIYLAVATMVYTAEKGLRAADKLAYPVFFDGAATLVLSFFMLLWMMRWRGQGWSNFGLRRPPSLRFLLK